MSWHNKNASSHPVHTSNFEDAYMIFSVVVKWDECADWNFSNSYKHTCYIESIESYGDILKRAYELGMKFITE